jgi:hypothetical protein
MKKIVKILMSLMLVVSFNSCSDGDNVIDEVLVIESGAVLRTLEVISNTLNSSDNSTEFSVSVEEQDNEDGGLMKSVHVYATLKDLTPGNGTTVSDDVLVKTFDASHFTTGPVGLPRGIVGATFGETMAASGLAASDIEPGDLFVFVLKLELTDGRVFDDTNAGGSITGGFFNSPFKYNALILCSPEPGDYLVDMHDSFGDGWQTDDGNGGSGLQVTVDGTIIEVGMCSPYGAAAGTFTGGTDCVVGDYYDASDTITIPVGAQEATWWFPGDQYGEISFEVYAPDSTLLFAGAQGATAGGLLPITLCATN